MTSGAGDRPGGTHDGIVGSESDLVERRRQHAVDERPEQLFGSPRLDDRAVAGDVAGDEWSLFFRGPDGMELECAAPPTADGPAAGTSPPRPGTPYRGLMLAAVLEGHGGPDQLVVREVPDPVPGPGEVCIDVTAAAINNTDIWSREGAYGPAPDHPTGWLGVPLDVPLIQGGDAAGRVRAVGDGVETCLVGRRVLVDPAEYDGPGPDATPARILGSERDGAFAERLVVPAGQVHDVTDSPLDDEELAALPIAAGTAMGMLDRAEVAEGETVVVTGASGGVGIAAVQLAAALGARVIAVSSAGKQALLHDAGAAEVVDRTRPDLHRTVAGLSPHGVDVVVDVVGGDGFGDWIPVLRRRGRIVVAGAIAGPRVTIDLRALYLEQRRIIGSTMHTPAQFDRLVDLARRGSLRPVIAARLPLDEIHEGQRLLRAGDAVGKIVLLPSDPR